MAPDGIVAYFMFWLTFMSVIYFIVLIWICVYNDRYKINTMKGGSYIAYFINYRKKEMKRMVIAYCIIFSLFVCNVLFISHDKHAIPTHKNTPSLGNP